MKAIYYKFFYITLLGLIFIRCGGDYKAFKTNNIKIIAIDSLEVENLNDENRIPEKMRQLCDVLVLEEKTSTQAFVLEPNLNRIDLGQELSLKTDVKTFSGNKNNPKVLGKHIKKNFEEVIIIPELLSSKTTMSNLKLNDAVNNYLLNNLGKDSLIIYSEKEPSFTIGEHTYKAYNDVEEVRKYMLFILKKNPKASFCVLWNPILSGVSEKVTVIDNYIKRKRGLKIIASKSINKKNVKFDRIVTQPEKSESSSAIIIDSPKKQKWSGESKTVNEVKNGVISGSETKSKQ